MEFGNLSPIDFESLCADISRERCGVSFRRYAPGRDGGVDIRHFRDNLAGDVVGQCKHMARSGYAQLRRQVRKEAQKARQLRCDRYLLYTSVPLTEANVLELSGILQQHSVPCAPDDIWGAEAIEDFLGAHGSIVRTHFKLWLSSTHVLGALLNNRIFTQSEHYRRQVLDDARLFVSSDHVAAAQAILAHRHACVLSGAPGVGKTTLANILLVAAISDGFEPVIVSRDISEAFDVWVPDKPQFILYDDFLGRSLSAEKLGKNEDARLLSLFESVNRDQSKRAVLTTREYLLQDAMVDHDRLQDGSLDVNKLIVAVDGYSQYQKAEILFNHLYFSDLPTPQLGSVTHNKLYRRLIAHPNYNPRLIADAIRQAENDTSLGGDFGQRLLEVFNSPTRLWEDVFLRRLNMSQKLLLLHLLVAPEGIPLRILEDFHRAVTATSSPVLFEDDMRMLEGTIVSLKSGAAASAGTRLLAHLENPGVADSVLKYLLDQRALVEVLVWNLPHVEDLFRLWQLSATPKRWSEYPHLLGATPDRKLVLRADTCLTLGDSAR